jgi:hypothetical protein
MGTEFELNNSEVFTFREAMAANEFYGRWNRHVVDDRCGERIFLDANDSIGVER